MPSENDATFAEVKLSRCDRWGAFSQSDSQVPSVQKWRGLSFGSLPPMLGFRVVAEQPSAWWVILIQMCTPKVHPNECLARDCCRLKCFGFSTGAS